jgi:hypothetical protein
VSLQNHLKLGNFTAGHGFTEAIADGGSNSFRSIVLWIETCDKTNLLFVPHVVIKITVVILQKLKCLGMTFELTERDSREDAMDHGERSLLTTGCVCCNRLLMKGELMSMRSTFVRDCISVYLKHRLISVVNDFHIIAECTRSDDT